MILLASATEMSAPDIARLHMTDASHVRKVIHDFFGALDVRRDRLFGRLRERKSARDVRANGSTSSWTTSRPTGPNEHPRGAANGRVELVPTPTYASYLNRIECHFAAIAEFMIKNADYSDSPTPQKAMADYIHLRNRTHGGGPIATIEARRRVA